MKTQDRNTNLCRVALALIFSFWFLIVGAPPAFCSAIPVDVLWAGLFDNSGQPLEGGKVYTYTAGTTSSKATYIDSAKVTPAANPVVLDAYGRAQIYADGAYKFVIKTSDDVTLITIDNLEYVSAQNPSTLSTTNLSATGATIGSLTAMVGTLVNMTISSATITLANLVSPNIANASMSGNLYNPTVTNGAFTNPVITGGTLTPATFTAPAGSSVATPTSATDLVNKGYVDAQVASVSFSIGSMSAVVASFTILPSTAATHTYNYTSAAYLTNPGVPYSVSSFSLILTNSSAYTKTYFVTMDLAADIGGSFPPASAYRQTFIYIHDATTNEVYAKAMVAGMEESNDAWPFTLSFIAQVPPYNSKTFLMKTISGHIREGGSIFFPGNDIMSSVKVLSW